MAVVAIACGTVSTAAHAISCTVSTLAVRFGAYNPLQAAPLSTTGTIQVACTCTGLDCVAFAYRIDVSAGQSGNVARREMRTATGRLQYNLYADPGFTTLWGTGIGLSGGVGVLYLLPLFGSRQVVTVYARVPARQVVPAGSYIDTPVVTIVY